MKLIAVATTGGDAPGMNAALRAVVKAATSRGLRVIGFERGYAGLLANDFIFLDDVMVDGLMHLGGTYLKSSRAEAMKTEEGISRAVEVLEGNGVEGFIAIGGNGSFRAACEIHDASGIPIVGIPASIDNDIAGTDATIGFDTAVNTALEAIDKIRDTATSHERIFVVEVMGRNRGFIALEVGLAAGAEVILVPEVKYDIGEVCERLKEIGRRGKRSGVVVMAEGAGDCMEVKKALEERAGFEVRLTRLGHIQRGGRPTARSRFLACELGAAAIEFLLEGRKRDMTALQGGRIVPVDLRYACTAEKPFDRRLYELAMALSA
ncbi:MAG: ATP-dependent 6-phosphofructokinase [Candidatus Bathyarchaeia archaeon]